MFGRLGARAARVASAVTRRSGTSRNGNGRNGNGRNGNGRNGNGNGHGRDAKTSDVVLLDMPPVLRAAEVSAVAPAADGVIMVIHAGLTRRMAASRAAVQIRRVGGRILGVVLVGVKQ